MLGLVPLSCQLGFFVKAGSGHLSGPPTLVGRHLERHVSLTWAPKRNPLLVVRHTSLGAPPLRGGTFQPGESGARWRGGGGGQLGKLTRWQGGWRPPHQGGCSLARWLGGLVAWWPTNILSNALQTLRTAQFDTHIHTGTDARTTNTISLTNEIHAKIIRHKNTQDRSRNMS